MRIVREESPRIGYVRRPGSVREIHTRSRCIATLVVLAARGMKYSAATKYKKKIVAALRPWDRVWCTDDRLQSLFHKIPGSQLYAIKELKG
jgi:hypothetical protein